MVVNMHLYCCFSMQITRSWSILGGGSVVFDSLLIVASIVLFCVCSMFCCILLCVLSSFAIILMGKGELVVLLCLSS